MTVDTLIRGGDQLKNKLIAVLAIVFVLTLMIPSITATVMAAPAVHEDFDATLTVTLATVPENARHWIDEEGVGHLRGGIFTFDINGDLVGTGEMTVNENLIPADSFIPTGDLQAKGNFTTEGGDIYLIYFDITLTEGIPSGTFLIHGTGDCKGTHITGTVSGGEIPVIVLDGTITTKP